jgi:hypothetical protein
MFFLCFHIATLLENPFLLQYYSLSLVFYLKYRRIGCGAVDERLESMILCSQNARYLTD